MPWTSSPDTPPEDKKEDYELDFWSGTLPIRTVCDYPIADKNLKNGIKIPDHIMDFYNRESNIRSLKKRFKDICPNCFEILERFEHDLKLNNYFVGVSLGKLTINSFRANIKSVLVGRKDFFSQIIRIEFIASIEQIFFACLSTLNAVESNSMHLFNPCLELLLHLCGEKQINKNDK